MPALDLTDEAITAYWNGKGDILEKLYHFPKVTAELNKKVQLKSLYDCITSEEEVEVVIEKLCKVFNESSEINKQLAGCRAVMVQYKDKDNFINERFQKNFRK